MQLCMSLMRSTHAPPRHVVFGAVQTTLVSASLPSAPPANPSAAPSGAEASTAPSTEASTPGWMSEAPGLTVKSPSRLVQPETNRSAAMMDPARAMSPSYGATAATSSPECPGDPSLALRDFALEVALDVEIELELSGGALAREIGRGEFHVL